MIELKRVEFEAEVTVTVPVSFSLDLPEIMTEKEIKEFINNHHDEIIKPKIIDAAGFAKVEGIDKLKIN